MGQMKELAMRQRYESGLLLHHDIPAHPLTEHTNILCPNCTEDYLMPNGNRDELECESCAQEFKVIEKNTVRFK